MSLLLTPPMAKATDEDRPVEAWVEKRYENGKVVEVVKIRLKSGKVVEVRPHLAKEEIPKLKSELPPEKTEAILKVIGTITAGLIAGIGIVLLMKKS